MNLSIHSLIYRAAKLTVKSVLLTAVCLSSVWAEQAPNDFAFLQYANSNVEKIQKRKGEAHQFLLSTPKRISNTLNIEDAVFLAGERTDLLLKIDQLGSSQQAFYFYQALLLKQGEILYQCEQRACGSSNYWANKIFNESKLYGRDSEQYYLAGRLKSEEKNYFLSIYVVKNGRKQQYIYLRYIPEIKQALAGDIVDDNKDRYQLKTWQTGVFFKDAQLKENDIAFIQQSLKEDQALKLWVLSYAALSSMQSASQVLNASQIQLKGFSEGIVDKLKVDSRRVMQKNIGPFADKPSDFSGSTWFKLYLLK